MSLWLRQIDENVELYIHFPVSQKIPATTNISCFIVEAVGEGDKYHFVSVKS